MKRFIALLLSIFMILSLCACGGAPATPTEEATEPAPTEAAGIPKKDNLKVLTLGHSLAVDANHMLALVAAAEGYAGLTVATLYHSGCSLTQHVDFLTNDKTEYDLYMSDSSNPAPPTILSDVTMYQALRYDSWDVIVMQAGVFETAYETTYTDGKIQTIQEYVNKHKLNKDAVFAWNIIWGLPTDTRLQDMYPYSPNVYTNGYVYFANSREIFFNSILDCVKKTIVPDETFVEIIPSGTAIENAHSSYMNDWDLNRDYAHANDYGRLIAAYVWYCKLMGIDHLDEMKQTVIPVKWFRSNTGLQDIQLTEMEINVALEAINNALKNPLEVTQSQYTEAPEGYVAK